PSGGMAVPLTPRTFRDSYAQARAARTANRRPARVPLLVRAGRIAARALPTWAGFRRLILSVGGFGALSYAAWLVAVPLGLAAAGLSLLILEALTGDTR
ncbi:MAG: hypothetical protein ACRDXB_05655, partial [Actinomycetes bacterium]